MKFNIIGLYETDTPKSDKVFIIKDWAGNQCFGGIEFTTFEDAWEYIYEKFDDEEEYQEYQVLEK